MSAATDSPLGIKLYTVKAGSMLDNTRPIETDDPSSGNQVPPVSGRILTELNPRTSSAAHALVPLKSYEDAKWYSIKLTMYVFIGNRFLWGARKSSVSSEQNIQRVLLSRSACERLLVKQQLDDLEDAADLASQSHDGLLPHAL